MDCAPSFLAGSHVENEHVEVSRPRSKPANLVTAGSSSSRATAIRVASVKSINFFRRAEALCVLFPNLCRSRSNIGWSLVIAGSAS